MGYHAFALDRVESDHAHLTGERVALLAMARRKGFAVPDGFVVLRKTFGDLVRDTHLKLLLPSLEKRLVARTLPMEAISTEMRKLILDTQVPRHIMLDIESGCKALGLGDRTVGKAVTLRACPVDLRLSSAPLERAVALTRLSDIEPRLKTCWASAFDPTNLEAMRHYGMAFEEGAPSVLITETVPAEVSGVLFSHAPNESGALLVEAVWGFQEALTEGKFSASRYLVKREDPAQVRAEEAEQGWEYALGPQGAMVRRELPADRLGRAKLSRLQVEELVRSALELERLVGSPVAVEWAIQAGQIFFLQVVPLEAPVPAPSEAEHAERYIEAVQAAEAAVPLAAAAPIAPAPPKAEAPAPTAPTPTRSLGPARETRARDAAPPKAKLLPVLRASLFVELPAGSRAADARHIPHAGIVLDLAKWSRGSDGRGALAASLAASLAGAAVEVFPRAVLVELSDLDPDAYEAMRELTEAAASPAQLERVMGAAMEELRLVASAAASVGATNIHIIAPFVKAAPDANALRIAMRAAGLSGGHSPHTLAFSELRNPSGLLYNVEFAEEQDGIIVRADRFYKALMREGAGAPGVADQAGTPPPSFVRALLQLTRAFERAGGTVLVLLESDGDFNTLWFYRELGVDGFIVRLEDAGACAAMLHDLETREPRGAKRRVKLR